MLIALAVVLVIIFLALLLFHCPCLRDQDEDDKADEIDVSDDDDMDAVNPFVFGTEDGGSIGGDDDHMADGASATAVTSLLPPQNCNEDDSDMLCMFPKYPRAGSRRSSCFSSRSVDTVWVADRRPGSIQIGDSTRSSFPNSSNHSSTSPLV